MTCEFAAQVQAYHDGELWDKLSPAQIAEIEAHIAQCPACAAELRSLRALANLIGRNLPVIDMPAGLLDRVHAEVQTVSDYSLLPLARSLVGLAAAVLVVASAGLLRFQSQDHASAPQPWEAAVFASSNESGQSNVQSSSNSMSNSLSNSMDPEMIVADLSRTSGH